MIKNIVFDFGDVFINLDKEATFKRLKELGVNEFTIELLELAKQYEMGMITTQEFVNTFKSYFPSISETDFKNAWNSMLLDFPLYRLSFLKSLANSKKYRIFLLSNTNDLHISWIQKTWGRKLFSEFKNCFEKFYLSHEIHLRKPNKNIYEFVIESNKLTPEETFFVDDTEENTVVANKLGIKTWQINPNSEDVVDLFSKKEFN
jgi:putative hydrolase of the HAD superfamily